MEMLQLRYFYDSAKSENFTLTAQKYDVPTTSVSAAIRRLEQELGCKLFDRSYNRIALNANGKRFQQALCIAFSEIDRAVNEISTHHIDRREIKLLVRGMRRRVTDRLSRFSALHPQISFQLFFSEIPGENYDIIIDDSKGAYDSYEKHRLYSMGLHLKCASTDPLCQKPLTLGELRDRVFVSMEPESNMHRILTNACARVGFQPKISAFCNDIECYEKLIATGMGIGIGREDSFSDSGISDLQVTDFKEHYTVYLYYRQSDYYGNVKKLVDHFKVDY